MHNDLKSDECDLWTGGGGGGGGWILMNKYQWINQYGFKE